MYKVVLGLIIIIAIVIDVCSWNLLPIEHKKWRYVLPFMAIIGYINYKKSNSA